MNNIHYTALSPLNKPSVVVKFDGIFNNMAVEWHAEICTTRYALTTYPDRYTQALRFIDITVKHNEYFVRIGLPLDVIGHADILKCIIMVRQYKRLSTGLQWIGQNSKDS